jgi:hypothetical protein
MHKVQDIIELEAVSSAMRSDPRERNEMWPPFVSKKISLRVASATHSFFSPKADSCPH